MPNVNPVHPVPRGLHTITPQLNVEGAAKAIDFYKAAFGAEEVMRAPDPSGQKIWHAELGVAGSSFFVNDVFPEMGDPNPSRSCCWIYVADCDALFKRAVAAGAKVEMPVTDMFWGDRMGQVSDPFGQKWVVATHVKDMTPDEVKAAEKAFIASMGNKK